MTTNAGRGAAQEPLEGGEGSEGLDLKRERLREAADARATANRLEREADACAITYQDQERRRQATAWHRQRVRELRAYADQIDPPAGVSEPEARGRELSLPQIAAACEAFLFVWRDPDAVSPAFGRPVRMLLDALAPLDQPTGEPYRPCAGCDSVGDSCRAVGCPATTEAVR